MSITSEDLLDAIERIKTERYHPIPAIVHPRWYAIGLKLGYIKDGQLTEEFWDNLSEIAKDE